jgi:hypothetical protein
VVVWGGGSASRVRARHAEGASVVAWVGVGVADLQGIDARPLDEVLGQEGRTATEAAPRTWCRLWGRVPLLDGDSFRDLVAWRGTSLLWLAEGALRGETAGPRCAALAETSLRLLGATGAGEVDAVGLDGPETVILARACTVRGALFHGSTPAPRPIRPVGPGRRGLGTRVRDLFGPGAPRDLRLGRSSGSLGEAAPVVVFPVGGYDETSLRPLVEPLEARLGHPGVVVTAADLSRWETRDVRRRASRAEVHLRERFELLRGAPGLHESYSHGGVGFADLASGDLGHLLLDHLPRAVRRLEAAIELLSRTRPAAVVVAGAARDDRRTLLAAAEALRVPGLVLRPAAPGPDDPDRADGGPQPAAALEWAPGSDAGPVLARLREVARARLGSE